MNTVNTKKFKRMMPAGSKQKLQPEPQPQDGPSYAQDMGIKYAFGGGMDGDPTDPLTKLIGNKPWIANTTNGAGTGMFPTTKNSFGQPFNTKVSVISPGQTDDSQRLNLNGSPFMPAATDKPEAAYNSVNTTTGTDTPLGTGRTSLAKPGFFSSANLKKLSNSSASLTPYLSNIANAFRKPPMPKTPVMDPYTSLSTVNYSNERNDVNTDSMASARATERNIDSNTAEAIKQFGNGQRFQRLSAINEKENNDNKGIKNQQAMMDAHTKELNTDKWGQ
jgi:hypothetical protein